MSTSRVRKNNWDMKVFVEFKGCRWKIGEKVSAAICTSGEDGEEEDDAGYLDARMQFTGSAPFLSVDNCYDGVGSFLSSLVVRPLRL